MPAFGRHDKLELGCSFESSVLVCAGGEGACDPNKKRRHSCDFQKLSIFVSSDRSVGQVKGYTGLLLSCVEGSK